MKPFQPVFWAIFLSLLTADLRSQNVQLYGVLPGVLTSVDVSERWSLSARLSSESNLSDRVANGRNFSAEVMNLDLEFVATYDLHPNLSLAGAYRYRFDPPFEPGANEHRIWQQATTIHRLTKYRVRNRFRLEQRWRSDDLETPADFDLRFRYRLSVDFPLQGEQLDDGEFYLNASTAWLITPTQTRAWFFSENRAYLGLGYRINNRHRLEPALDFRTRRIDQNGYRRQFLFFRFMWVTKLPTASN